MDTTVKGLQLRLMAMGYPLPKYGPDGGLGTETLEAIDAALDELETIHAGKPAVPPAPVLATPAGPFYIGAGQRLSEADFAGLAARSGIEEAKIRAINDVEAAGRGFHSSGALVCLYEPHIAYRQTSGAVRDKLVAEGLAYASWRKGYPATSFDRIDRCTAIAGAEVAALSTSWGLGQIMGFNHKACGFASALEMVRAFAESEANQLAGMLAFIKANPA
uniref:N-acetylmuramidase domain-containing protein n=1 Tax=uncultured Rhizobium sp. TaxID=155567 RepID=UPI00262D3E96